MYRTGEVISGTVTVKYGTSSNYKKVIEKLLWIKIEKKLSKG